MIRRVTQYDFSSEEFAQTQFVLSDSICSQHLSCRMGNSNPENHMESRIQLMRCNPINTVNPSTQKAQGKSLWAEAILATHLVPDQPGDLHPENKHIHTHSESIQWPASVVLALCEMGYTREENCTKAHRSACLEKSAWQKTATAEDKNSFDLHTVSMDTCMTPPCPHTHNVNLSLTSVSKDGLQGEVSINT